MKLINHKEENLNTLPNSATVLVVDDNPVNLKLLNHTLSSAGYKVKMEVNGLNVIPQVKNSMPDLILLDIMLPNQYCSQITRVKRL